MTAAAVVEAGPGHRARRGWGADGPLVLGVALLVACAPLAGVSPLLVAAAAALCVSAGYLVRRPAAAMRFAVVVVLLPPGLLSVLLQSVLDVASVGLATLAWLVAAKAEPRSVALRAPVPILVVFLLWSLLTVFWSATPALSSDVLRRYLLGVVLLLLITDQTRSRRDVDRLMDALAVAAWVLAACGLWALAQGSYSPDGRLDVLAVNANQVGNLLLLLTPGVMWPVAAPGRTSRLRLAAALVFLVVALVLISESASRGSLLAFVLLLLGFTVTRTLRRWGGTAVVAGLLLLVAAPFLFTTALDRLQESDPSQLSRTTLWAAGLELVADHPFGVGPGLGPHVMPDYINARVSQNHFETRSEYPAHNPLIEVATDSGVIGAALYGTAVVVAAGSFLAATARAVRTGDRAVRAYGAVVGTCSIAFVLVWLKSGGESYNPTTFVLLALWLVAPAAGRAGRGTRPAEARGNAAPALLGSSR